MNTYVVLLRGINVGGKNKVPMALLRECLETLGYANVRTYIASGNVIVTSDKPVAKIKDDIEHALIKNFTLDSDRIKVLVVSHSEMKTITSKKPKGFGDEPTKYYCDAVFLIDISADEAIKVFDPREGVDTVWKGDGVIYSQRLGSERTKSRLSKIIGTPAYASMTIRSWNTVTKLLALLDDTKTDNA